VEVFFVFVVVVPIAVLIEAVFIVLVAGRSWGGLLVGPIGRTAHRYGVTDVLDGDRYELPQGAQ
jgi:hypothetical protein